MILDCAGLDEDEDEDDAGLASAAPGEAGSSCPSSAGVATGSDDSLVRWTSVLDRPAGLVALPLPRFRIVLEDDIRVTACRDGPLTGVPGMLSFRGRGESLRMDKDEGTRACVPPPDVVRRTISARNGLSAPGCGDGAGEPRAAVTALRICARSWEL